MCSEQTPVPREQAFEFTELGEQVLEGDLLVGGFAANADGQNQGFCWTAFGGSAHSALSVLLIEPILFGRSGDEISNFSLNAAFLVEIILQGTHVTVATEFNHGRHVQPVLLNQPDGFRDGSMAQAVGPRSDANALPNAPYNLIYGNGAQALGLLFSLNCATYKQGASVG